MASRSDKPRGAHYVFQKPRLAYVDLSSGVTFLPQDIKNIDQYKRTNIDKEPIRNRTKDVQPMPSARKHRCNSDCHWLITERWKMQESHFNGCAFDRFPLCSTACDWTNTNQRETAIKS